MRNPPHVTGILKSGGFSFHYLLRRFLKVGFVAQCCIIAGIAGLAIATCSIIDGTLRLEGRNVGLLEHPGIWVFLGLQIALPLTIRHSLRNLLKARRRIGEISGDNKFTQSVSTPLSKFLRLQDNESRFAATVIYGVGLIAFVWNTYQNQHPGSIVPFDFWDSKTYLCGFWVTRVYRLYMFGWLIPYVALIHIGILLVTLRLIRKPRLKGSLKLVPFHPDGVGGLGFVPSLVTAPIIVTALFSSVSTAAAFEVHRAADITPMMGLAIVLITTVIAYLIPILFLRADIVALKRETIRRLRNLQQAYYSKIAESEMMDFETLKL
jgi:hypothetical protein